MAFGSTNLKLFIQKSFEEVLSTMVMGPEGRREKIGEFSFPYEAVKQAIQVRLKPFNGIFCQF